MALLHQLGPERTSIEVPETCNGNPAAITSCLHCGECTRRALLIFACAEIKTTLLLHMAPAVRRVEGSGPWSTTGSCCLRHLLHVTDKQHPLKPMTLINPCFIRSWHEFDPA
eukprot:jgi/Ulvmu1/10214/UM060_0014.1